ncbi:1-deoxy-D-xylulose-5-phosphate synthase [Helicobacter monodelphidis]|uniref:1-deoxy-D-xylulose-5-phosphate synthase n=1 Tax=Helicobacter sp. 15-1451 TaxID=2004995 RepID=UPI000DCF2356|nr:1-deoxy-D-xylulose-5-phosphate synthase [Helicobacter sp. 15-1451]RAX57443.1 1-deoxy-D-xylulose-5-phosphate synthase [Helicobacter sp. 15-1451]
MILEKSELNIKEKSIEELEVLCSLIRKRILEVVSKNGGHLSSTLGATELIVAMHFVFDSPNDPFIFDVSHQAYAHKLLTNRWEEFESLRQTGGLSGFTKPQESEHDYFIAGHSSTSISLGVGAAKSIAIKQENRIPVVLIGDGSLSAGLCYEALNELGDRKYPLVIILNDNEMSIAEPIGAISKYLSQAIAGGFFQTLKAKAEPIFKKLPEGATYMAKRFEESLKLITPGLLFEELGLEYIGPIDGHNLKEIIEALHIAKGLRKPIVIHAQTIKGKGYKIAEGHFESWHGVSPFDLSSGKALTPVNITNAPAPTSVFSKTLLELARKDEKIVGVTAAMPSGTGMDALIKEFPNRFWDVAIAEAHAVTSMAAAAKEGLKPFVAIYSTFLQRAFDSLMHDVGISSLPVRFAIDRGGIVGEDGETHQGLFDVGYLRLIPHFTLLAPYCNAQLKDMVKFSYTFDQGPIAFRYPRKKFIIQDNELTFSQTEWGKGEILLDGKEIAFIGYGNGVGRAFKLIKALETRHNQPLPALVDLRFVKPLDSHLLLHLAQKYKKWFVFSDNSVVGGVASALMEWQMTNHLQIQTISFEFEDDFITHGNADEIAKQIHIDTESLLQRFLAYQNQ